jgi:hypothetical protein
MKKFKLAKPNLDILPDVIQDLKSYSTFSAKSKLFGIIEDRKYPEMHRRKVGVLKNIFSQVNYTPIANWLIHNNCVQVVQTGNMRYQVNILNKIHHIDIKNIDPKYIQTIS